jgi:hypothetical protein
VIVHEVGTNTAGFSPADDRGTEVCTGSVIDGPTDAGARDDGGANTDAGADGDSEGEGADDGEADTRTDGEDGAAERDANSNGFGETAVAGAAGSDALRLPACLPKRNAPTHSATRSTAPPIASVRLLDRFMKLT